MINGNESRLDRVERILESIAQRQESTQQQIDSNARAIAANSAGMTELRQQQQQLHQSLNEQIADVVGLIGTYAEQAEQDRAALHADVRSLIEALRERCSGNGKAD
jgi:NTP pyrophosphatase (non-canonical NTP hydrolase)